MSDTHQAARSELAREARASLYAATNGNEKNQRTKEAHGQCVLRSKASTGVAWRLCALGSARRLLGLVSVSVCCLVPLFGSTYLLQVLRPVHSHLN
jgi:hypothetical protein